MIKGRLRTWSMGIFLSVVGEAFAIENSWYFSAEQIEVAYRYRQNFGSRLQSPLSLTIVTMVRPSLSHGFRAMIFLLRADSFTKRRVI